MAQGASHRLAGSEDDEPSMVQAPGSTLRAAPVPAPARLTNPSVVLELCNGVP